jgi:hypothetical protein
MRFHTVARMRRRQFHFSPAFFFVAVCDGGNSAYGGRGVAACHALLVGAAC